MISASHHHSVMNEKLHFVLSSRTQLALRRDLWRYDVLRRGHCIVVRSFVHERLVMVRLPWLRGAGARGKLVMLLRRFNQSVFDRRPIQSVRLLSVSPRAFRAAFY